jgi:hypothetical protein
MVSLQPVTQSYVEEPESCFLPSFKNYRKGSLMDNLMVHSPLFAYLAQVGMLDDDLDSPEFKGTCFAPCEEYCRKYFNVFHNQIDHLKARRIVLCSLLRKPVTKEQLFKDYQIVPTLYRYFNLPLSYSFSEQQMKINHNLTIVIPDLKCNNGILHLTNGLIDADLSGP